MINSTWKNWRANRSGKFNPKEFDKRTNMHLFNVSQIPYKFQSIATRFQNFVWLPPKFANLDEIREENEKKMKSFRTLIDIKLKSVRTARLIVPWFFLICTACQKNRDALWFPLHAERCIPFADQLARVSGGGTGMRWRSVWSDSWTLALTDWYLIWERGNRYSFVALHKCRSFRLALLPHAKK